MVTRLKRGSINNITRWLRLRNNRERGSSLALSNSVDELLEDTRDDNLMIKSSFSKISDNEVFFLHINKNLSLPDSDINVIGEYFNEDKEYAEINFSEVKLKYVLKRLNNAVCFEIIKATVFLIAIFYTIFSIIK